MAVPFHVNLCLNTRAIPCVVILFFLFQQTTIYAQSKIKWKFKSDGRIYSSPTIDENLIFIGSADHKLYAINKTTGKKEWEFKTKGAVHATPSVNKSFVYICSSDGNMYALDKKTGTQIWKFTSQGEKTLDMWDYYISSPVLDSTHVFFGSGDGFVYSLNNQNGKLTWKFSTKGIVHATPVVAGNAVYIGSYDGRLYALNKQSGQLIWDFKTVGAQHFPTGEIQKKVLYDNGNLFFGSRDYNMYALNAATGTGLWNFRQPQGWIISAPVAYRDYLYYGTSDAHLFYCMDKVSGEIKWTFPLSMRVYGEAVVHKDIVYFGTFDGKVIGLDYLTGEKKWEFQTEQSKLNYDTIYDKSGNFRKDFDIYGNDPEQSELKIQKLGSILSTPHIESDIIYFGSSDGSLYAIEL